MPRNLTVLYTRCFSSRTAVLVSTCRLIPFTQNSLFKRTFHHLLSFYYFNIFYLSLFDLIMTLAKRRTFYMLLRNVLSQFLWLNVLKTTSFSNNNNNNNNNNNIIIIYYYFYCDCDCFVIVNCCCYCYYILLQYSNCLYPQLNNTQKDDYMYLCYSLLQRVGYLAASQSFHEDLDILMLTTNMIRKVLIS